MIKENKQSGEITVLAIPFDLNSSYLRGPALAPPRIREALYSESANMWTEKGVDLEAVEGWKMVGDLEITGGKSAFEEIELALGDLLQCKARVISLGGDHSIIYPIMRAYAKKYANLSILQFDAHPDLYDELDGDRHSHACPFARIMEEGLVQRLVQIGIRTMTGHQREQAQRFGVEVIEMHALSAVDQLAFEGPVYLSFDMDCLDPAFAPGVSHYEPGGLSTRAVLAMIQNLDADIVGADIVEYNPERDPQGITAMVAAKILKEILGLMIAHTLFSGDSNLGGTKQTHD